MGALGTRQNVTVTFTSSDGLLLTNLSLSSNVSFVDGWSGPASFNCPTVTTGSGCVLNLTYAPTAVASGSLPITAVYTNNAGYLAVIAVSIPYASSTDNNINATVAPAGQITALVGASQAVTVNFDTDDGNPATGMSVTSGLTALPAGWSSTAATFTCASVSTGNGCQLPLSYAPTATGSGTLTLNYSYFSGTGKPKTGTVNIAYAGTTHDHVIGTILPAGQIATPVNTSLSASLIFTTDDGNTASGLNITSGLQPLPTGWQAAVSHFSCATVNTGSSCMLPLNFAPTAAGNGTLTFNYSYNDDAGTAKTGTVNVPYMVTTYDSVIATAAPSGQINARVGASQAVTLTFTTSDGNPATALTLSSHLSALPAGWSSTAQSLTCASVSTGNGCQLPLTFAPTAAVSGTLTLNYSYTNNAGVASTGTASIPYATTVDDNVTGTVSPSGQIATIGGGFVPVTVTFDTDDGNTATGLSLTTALSALPMDWSSTVQSFTCASVSTGNGCQLSLVFAPSLATTGTLTLGYSYNSDLGTAKTGTVSIPYSATEHDNVRNSVSPTGQINAIVNAGTQAVYVTFTTDDGAVASGLSITSGLSALPSGWSGASSFTCSAVSTGNGCQLNLNYAPTAYGSGTLSLAYAYTDNAGGAKTGTVSIPYAATTHDNVTGAVSPTGTVSLGAGQTQAVTVTFTTDDMNPASGMTVTSGLGSFPSGWTGPSQFGCSSISTGTGCQLSLSYAPVAAGSGTLTLSYSYSDDAGSSKNGTVSIPYSATAPHVYVVDASYGVYLCAQGSGGTLSGCTLTGNGLNGGGPTTITFGGNFAYVSEFNNNAVEVCAVAGDGTLSGCTSTGSNFTSPTHSSIHGGYFYVGNGNSPGQVTQCAINSNSGALSGCTTTASGVGNNIGGVSVGDTYSYVNEYVGTIYECTTGGTGSLSSCSTTASGVTFATKIITSGGYAYMSTTSDVTGCAIGSSNGALTNCVHTNVTGSGGMSLGLSISGTTAYVTENTFNSSNFTSSNDVYLCTVSGAALTNCAVSDGGVTYNNLWDVVIH